jgi:hypothetical protein
VRRLAAAVLFGFVLLLLAAAPAGARTARDLSYSYDRVWPALLRFLRVDEKVKVTEKSEEAGYILFDLTDGKRTFPGAAELSRTTDSSGRPAVHVSVKIEDRPSYMEMGLLDRLADKLHDELGDPPQPPPAASPPPPDAPPASREDKR